MVTTAKVTRQATPHQNLIRSVVRDSQRQPTPTAELTRTLRTVTGLSSRSHSAFSRPRSGTKTRSPRKTAAATRHRPPKILSDQVTIGRGMLKFDLLKSSLAILLPALALQAIPSEASKAGCPTCTGFIVLCRLGLDSRAGVGEGQSGGVACAGVSHRCSLTLDDLYGLASDETHPGGHSSEVASHRIPVGIIRLSRFRKSCSVLLLTQIQSPQFVSIKRSLCPKNSVVPGHGQFQLREPN